MTWVRALVNGNEIEVPEDEAKHLVSMGIFEFMEPQPTKARKPTNPAPAEPVPTVRRSRKRA